MTTIPQHQNAKSLMSEEEYHSLKETYKMLSIMIDPKKSPRLPKVYRDMAKKCLRYYPHSRDYDKEEATFTFFNPNK